MLVAGNAFVQRKHFLESIYVFLESNHVLQVYLVLFAKQKNDRKIAHTRYTFTALISPKCKCRLWAATRSHLG